jgi:hypothetical protein
VAGHDDKIGADFVNRTHERSIDVNGWVMRYRCIAALIACVVVALP